MRKRMIAGVFGVIPLVALGCFFLKPMSQSEQCFARIKIGMNPSDTLQVLTDCEFELCHEICRTGNPDRFTFLNRVEDRRIVIRLDESRGVVEKYLDPHEGVIQRAWRSVSGWAGIPSRQAPITPGPIVASE